MYWTILRTIMKNFSCIKVFLVGIITGILEWIIPAIFIQKDVKNDIILITGGGSGLGRAIALEYAKLGSSIILWDVNQSGLNETKELVEEEYNKRKANKGKNNEEGQEERSFCLNYVVDVSDKEIVKKCAEQVLIDLNRDRNQASSEPEKYVTVLINNAGIYHGLLLQELSDTQIERIFKINVLAHFWTVRAFLPKMIEHEKGHIVEIASMGGIAGMLKQVDYCATKFATVGFEESLSIELDHMGLGDKIKTTAICPFFFSSNLFTGFDKNSSLMSSEYVAKETVKTMRCNYSRVMLPKSKGYRMNLAKTFMPRSAVINLTKAMGFAESIKEIKGAAV